MTFFLISALNTACGYMLVAVLKYIHNLCSGVNTSFLYMDWGLHSLVHVVFI